ncbi:MAG: branched-chain amino acid ABC transporter permease [Clostridia bacterium]|nr:branched-chain amino acid ABC transporter permease [Clostridia bacterium]
MKKYLNKNYALLGRTPPKNDRLTKAVRSLFFNPIGHYILFGVLCWVVAYLATNKIIPDIIPYSLQSSLAISFSFAIASIGFCLLMGYSGLASLGTGGFIGIGSYAVHYVMNEAELSLPIAILVALVVAAIIGVVVGFISLRIEGIYLVILTLGLSEILRNVYMVVEDKIKVKNFELFGTLIKKQHSLYIVATLLVIVMIITHNIINSPTGRAMLAMKNSTAAAQAMGISLIKYRLLAFVICTMYAALAGVMIMITIRSIQASNASGYYALITSLNILAAVIIGGFKSIWGAVFGAFVMYGMQTAILQDIDFFAENPEFITFISGALVIIVVMFFPGGLAQLLLELKAKLKVLFKKIKEGIYGKDLG